MDGNEGTETTISGSETTGNTETAGTGSTAATYRGPESANPQSAETTAGDRPEGTAEAGDATEGTAESADKRLDGDSDSGRAAVEVLTRQRDRAIREAHAYKAILAAHNIDLAVVNSNSLEKIQIVEGEAVGGFDYSAPGFSSHRVSASAVDSRQAAQALNMDSIRDMSVTEINQNWESVKAVLAAQRSK